MTRALTVNNLFSDILLITNSLNKHTSPNKGNLGYTDND
jgi:hypothetical protein